MQYCTPEHQSLNLPKHRIVCNDIAEATAFLHNALAVLSSDPASIVEARCKVVHALKALAPPTRVAIQRMAALVEQCWPLDKVCLLRMPELFDWPPILDLQLGRDQRAYDAIRW